MKLDKKYQNSMLKEIKFVYDYIMCPFAEGSQINKFAPSV